MDKNKFTDIVIDIDSMFSKVSDRSFRLIEQDVIKLWLNSLKANSNIYVVSSKLDTREIERKLRKYRVHRIIKAIYVAKDDIEFRRNVIDNLIGKQFVSRDLSNVLFVSGNPYFITQKTDLKLNTCYVKELNRKNSSLNVGTFRVDKLSSINSLTPFTDRKKEKVPLASKVSIKDYLYIIGSGYTLVNPDIFNKKAVFLDEEDICNKDTTLAVSDDLYEIRKYNSMDFDTLFINTGINDCLDIKATYEKKLIKK